ncbi:MAG: hypothetical protein P4L50_06440 [Anaerolineaceae bacterium]|nr:hypothetical protein [Anaerolineaceae bacterium]
MNSPTPSQSIEEKLYAANRMAPRPEFLAGLRARLVEQPRRPLSLSEKVRLAFRRPLWVTVLVVIFLLAAALLAVGPQRVLAAFQQLFGYIPGVGIINESAPIRVLVEPVTITRSGISITVTSATLTADRTHIEYRIFGVPGSAYPNREDVHGCFQQDYLRLPDGTKLDRMDEDFLPIPPAVNEAVLVIPCISDTLPGKVPENWQLPLRFVLAPPDLTVMPVIELSPSPQPSPTKGATALSENGAAAPTAPTAPTAPERPAVTVDKVIETGNGYILIGQIQPQSQAGEWPQVTGRPQIRDASGKSVPYTIPLDVNPDGANGWAVQFQAAGLAYPLTITFLGVEIRQADPGATAEFTFDAGSNPQPGQQWTPNQDIQLAGHTLKLVSIAADSRGGYSFEFQGDPQVDSAGLQIVGYTPNGGGGGGGAGLTNGTFSVTLSYAHLPTGVLSVILSDLTVTNSPITWQGQWSPAMPRTDLPANPTSQPGVCLTADSLAQLKPAPAGLSAGKALMYEQLQGNNQWGLVLYNLDGSGKQVVVPNGNWGALSPDGRRVAYSATDNGIHIINLDSQSEKVLPGAGGFNLHWSPDGKQIAYVGMGNNIIDSVFVVDSNGANVRQISSLSYESVVGWSPDSSNLYFVIPFTGGAAWKVYSFDLVSGKGQELFTIENGTPKFLDPNLSPDGKWIAYRGRDNSSVYMVHPDGSDMHLLLDNAGDRTIAWSQSGWLGVSLDYNGGTSVVLLKPDSCEAYLLAALHGDLEGLSVP